MRVPDRGERASDANISSDSIANGVMPPTSDDLKVVFYLSKCKGM